MDGNFVVEHRRLSLYWDFKIEQENNRLIFEMLYPTKIRSYYWLKFSNISTPTTYRKMFLHNFEISKGENIILDNSEIKFLNLRGCSNAKIINSIIKKRLFLYNCTNLEIENCDINTFHVPNTNNAIKVKNTIIKKTTEGSEDNYQHVG